LNHQTAEVQVWVWHLSSLGEALAATFLPTLIPAEQDLHSSIKSPRRQREYLAGHHLVRVALTDLMPDWAEQHSFTLGADHWLELNGPHADRIDFNLSHSGDWVICVIGRDCRVGVDIEAPRRRRAYRALAAEYFAAAESERLATLPEDSCREAFYQLWTLKESYLKARKVGISAAELATEFIPLEQAAADWYCYSFRMPTAAMISDTANVFGALTVSAPLAAPWVIREYRAEEYGLEGALTGSHAWTLEVPEPLTPRRWRSSQ
jgi:phosphopantetheinyl transferase